MSKESSRTSNNTASKQSSLPTPDSYIGKFVSVTSKVDIRYEGFIYHLDPEKSVLGLRDVRMYGTEGRRKIGQQIPPSNQVHEHLVFYGKDIKDLQVKVAASSLQARDVIYNDPAIIQLDSYVGSSSSSKLVPVTSGPLTKLNSYSESPALNAGSYPSMFSLHHFGTQLGTQDASLSGHVAASPSSMSTSPTKWQGYTGSIAGVNQQSLPSSMSYSQYFGTHLGAEVPSLSGHIAASPSSMSTDPTKWQGYMGSITGVNQHSLPTSMLSSHHFGSHLGTQDSSLLEHIAASRSSIPTGPTKWRGYMGSITDVNQHILPSAAALYPMQNPSSTMMPVTNLQPSQPYSTLINSNGLTMTSSLSHWTVGNPEDQVANKVDTHPASLLPLQSLFYSTSSATGPKSEPSVRLPGAMPTPTISQLKFSEHSPARNLYPDRKDVGVVSSTFLNTVSSTSPAVQLNHLPLPPPSQKLQNTSQFNEEFGMQAMNGKFKKDEIWRHLGKINQGNKVEVIEKNGTDNQVLRDNSSGSVPKGEHKLQHTPEFTEEFDFQAMNEKFNKDEIWEYFGKANHIDRKRGTYENGTSSRVSPADALNSVSSRVQKPTYYHDNFFDNISGNSNSRGARAVQKQSPGRLKLDHKTVGDFQRRTQSNYGGHSGRQGEHLVQYRQGRGYNRGRGEYRQR